MYAELRVLIQESFLLKQNLESFFFLLFNPFLYMITPKIHLWNYVRAKNDNVESIISNEKMFLL